MAVARSYRGGAREGRGGREGGEGGGGERVEGMAVKEVDEDM